MNRLVTFHLSFQLFYLSDINIKVRENRKGNQEWTIQRHRLQGYRIEDAKRIQTKQESQYRKIKDEQYQPHKKGGLGPAYVYGRFWCIYIMMMFYTILLLFMTITHLIEFKWIESAAIVQMQSSKSYVSPKATYSSC